MRRRHPRATTLFGINSSTGTAVSGDPQRNLEISRKIDGWRKELRRFLVGRGCLGGRLGLSGILRNRYRGIPFIMEQKMRTFRHPRMNTHIQRP